MRPKILKALEQVGLKEKSRSYPDFRQGDIDLTSERRVEESVAILIHHCDQAFHHKL